MTVITCLCFPNDEKLIYSKFIGTGIILLPGETIVLEEWWQYDWKFRDMKMDFGEYKKRYIDIKKY
jgi:hypothetical protein